MLAAKGATKNATPSMPAERSKSREQPSTQTGANADWARLAMSVQPKLSVSSPDDPSEREADAVADHVMRMAVVSPIASTSREIRRKCGCAAGQPCSCHDEDKPIVSRRASSTSPALAPVRGAETAARATTGGGQPLSSDVRSYFEPRFQMDFGDVRVHTHGEGASAARNIRAHAYTLGRDVVFGDGEYAPQTTHGRRLLAHELVHVAQQGAARPLGDAVSVSQTTGRIARDDTIEFDIDPNCPPDQICLTITNGPKAHQPLTEQDKQAIMAATGASAPAAAGVGFSKDGPRFVLHDTGTSFGAPATESKHLSALKAQDNTPVGEGAASYVTAAGAPAQTHTHFFDAQRPTATEFERGNDLMNLFTRETNMQLIWSLTDPAQQNAAISSYLALFPTLSTKDIASETKKALANLDASKSTPSSKKGAKPVVMTTATGAVSQICDAVTARGAAGIAVKGQEAALAAACKTMKPVFDARKTRIADTTNVEIVAEKGSDCDTSAGATPFAGYAPAAYDAVARLYVLAALEAGQFPEITTHYFLDSTTPAGSPGPVTKSQNRCDPRCFDLDLLYSKIATILNHGAGSTYGITPLYGTTFGTSNVWWPQNVCGSAHGTPPASSTPTKTKGSKKKSSPKAKP